MIALMNLFILFLMCFPGGKIAGLKTITQTKAKTKMIEIKKVSSAGVICWLGILKQNAVLRLGDICFYDWECNIFD